MLLFNNNNKKSKSRFLCSQCVAAVCGVFQIVNTLHETCNAIEAECITASNVCVLNNSNCLSDKKSTPDCMIT